MMRQGPQQNKNRMRGRNRKGPNPLTRSYESNGPDVKIRGTALHIAEKYVTLARDAQSSGDRVAAESYLQHAEHYYRIVAAAQAQMPQPQPIFRSDEESDDDFDDRPYSGYEQQGPRDGQNAGGGGEQPYVNGAPHGYGSGNMNGGSYSGAPRSEPPPLVGEIEGDEDEGQGSFAGAQGQAGAAQGEQTGYRTRRRRPNRGRGRRPEGEGGAAGQPGGQGFGQEGGGGSQPESAPSREPTFSDD